MSEYIIKQIAAASVPNAPVGAFTLFLDTDGNWKKKDENGVVSLVAGVTDKNLEQVLTVGNSTGNNDIIVQDNKVIKSSTGDTIMSFGSNTMTINAGSFATDVAVSNVSMNSLGTSMSLFKSDFSKIGFFQVIENSTGNQTTGPLPNYPVVSGSQNSTINQNVINTSINGGNNIIAKTNNTDYSNQNGYNTGTAGELIVNHTPSATDRTQTHQDADGTIALLSDISAPGVDSVTGDGVDNTDPLNPVLSFPTPNEIGAKPDFTENSAFNKDFGTGSGTVLQGDTRTITPTEITTVASQSGTNTGDETDASIKSKYENNTDTNAFTDAEKTNLSNQSGTNTNDETTSTIQTKRPIKTVNGQTLEGSGNVVISSVSSINSASFISSLSQNVGTLLNGTGTNIQINLTNILGPNTFGYNIAAGNVIIPTAGWYKISYKCLTESSTNNRQNTGFVVKRNLIDVLGTFTAGYVRNFINDEASAALSPFIPQFQFSAGDTIGIYAISQGDTNQTSFTTAQECVLTIEYLG